MCIDKQGSGIIGGSKLYGDSGLEAEGMVRWRKESDRGIAFDVLPSGTG